MANDLPETETGGRLEQITYRVTGDGRHVIFTCGTSGGATQPPARFFTGYEGLGLLIMTMHQAARAQIEGLAKSGAAEELTKTLRSMIVTHVKATAVGLSSFAVDPMTARTLGQSLIDTAAHTAPKSSLS